MEILNQLSVRFPKWVVSWSLVVIDAVIGYYVINNIIIDTSNTSINYSIFSIFIVLQTFWCFIFWATNLYNGDAEVSRFGETETLIKLTFLIMSASIFLLGIDISLGPVKSQYIIRYWILFSFLTMLNRWVIRSIQKLLLKKGFGQHNVIIIGTGDSSSYVTEKLLSHRQQLYRVIGLIKTNNENNNENKMPIFLGEEKDLKEIIAKNPVSDIVIALDDMDHNHIMKLISVINGAPVSIKIVPDLYEVISGLARTEQISGMPLIEVNFKESKWSSSGLKRALDFILSSIALIALFPIAILIGVIIKLNSKGPIIYSQKRLGYRGMSYKIYKFRSMVVDAEDESGPVWALDDDPRVTSFGKTLRKYRIDELPQLINVFLGHMSLIGPRPERPYFIEKLKEKFPLYERRFRVRPGITGWSQIKHPSDLEDEDVKQKLRYDFYYIENLSFNLDLKILISTIVVVLSGKGR
jgi:exopolysaccharide biosynthesis polyprenyl glycosylphosphotransferase